jgi:uncharacterized protein
MSVRKDSLVGHIQSVNGNLISIKMVDSVRSTMPIIDGLVYRVGQIGSFLRVPLGYANLYGIVTNVGADAVPESLKETILSNDSAATKWLRFVLVGERIGNRFERGITQFPAAGDEAHLVTVDDLDIIYGGFSNTNSAIIGNISFSESLPAKIDVDKLVTRHCAIVGSTGSGKSNVVAVILDAISKGPFESERILIIDPHGEYDNTLSEYSKIFKINADVSKGEQELSIPYWALPVDELLRLFPGNINDQQSDYIRGKILEKKIYSANAIKNKPDSTSISSDSPIPFSIRKLWFELDDFERQTFLKIQDPQTKETRLEVTTVLEKGDPETLKSNKYEVPKAGPNGPFLNQQAKYLLTYLDGMRNRILNQRYNFLFKPGDWEPSLDDKIQMDLDALLSGWLGHEKPITILNLAGIPAEIMSSISGALLKIVYDALFWAQNLPVGGRQQPLLVVLEEAHNYLRAGEDSISSRTVQTIAKEGRKYGVGLMLITQRPSELDETVLSQCGTLIALRMTNKNDRNHISSAIQDDLVDMVGLLPSLRTGEALIMGECVRIPSRVKIEKMARAPKSSDPHVTTEWKKSRPNKTLYQNAVELWRKQRF